MPVSAEATAMQFRLTHLLTAQQLCTDPDCRDYGAQYGRNRLCAHTNKQSIHATGMGNRLGLVLDRMHRTSCI